MTGKVYGSPAYKYSNEKTCDSCVTSVYYYMGSPPNYQVEEEDLLVPRICYFRLDRDKRFSARLNSVDGPQNMYMCSFCAAPWTLAFEVF